MSHSKSPDPLSPHDWVNHPFSTLRQALSSLLGSHAVLGLDEETREWLDSYLGPLLDIAQEDADTRRIEAIQRMFHNLHAMAHQQEPYEQQAVYKLIHELQEACAEYVRYRAHTHIIDMNASGEHDDETPLPQRRRLS